MKRVKVIIKGRVQGVFFRANVEDRAKKLDLNGYVMNKEDYVEAVFIGEEEKVNQMLDFCSKGPEGAKVKGIELENYIGEDIDGFRIEETV
ncbi:acylphosphatase [archaeon]|nr:acylphosphatase [archaeon]